MLPLPNWKGTGDFTEYGALLFMSNCLGPGQVKDLSQHGQTMQRHDNKSGIFFSWSLESKMAIAYF